MKKYFYIFIIVSCSKFLLSQNYYSKIKKEYLSQNWSDKSTELELQKLNFESKHDTLIIIAMLMDCGEFGGHFEYIKCYYLNNALVSSFYQEPPNCEYDEKPSKEIYSSYKKGNQQTDSVLLANYIEQFKKTADDDGAVSNAPVSLWIKKGNEVYYKLEHVSK